MKVSELLQRIQTQLQAGDVMNDSEVVILTEDGAELVSSVGCADDVDDFFAIAEETLDTANTAYWSGGTPLVMVVKS